MARWKPERRLLLALLLTGACLIPRPLPAGLLSPETLFRAPEIVRVALSPSGDHIATARNDPDGQFLTVRTRGVENATSVAASLDRLRFDWVDGDTLLVALEEGEEMRFELVDIEANEYIVHSTIREIEATGWPVDVLPLEGGVLVWADWDGRASSVYRLGTQALLDPTGPPHTRVENPTERPSLGREHLVAQLRERVLYWLSDRRGLPRAALVLGDDDPVRLDLLHRAREGERWRRIGSWSQGDKFPRPVGIAENGRDLLVISEEGRDTAALRRYLVDEERLGEVVFATPEFDVLGVVWGYRGYELSAAYYEESGTRRYHYFNPLDARLRDWLAAHHPEKTAHLTSWTPDRRLSTVLLTGPSDPGRYVLVDAGTWTSEELGAVMPWLDPALLSPVRVLDVTTEDGLSVEAFLTLPRLSEGTSPPLVVMPHGGPIGVRDSRSFDPMVQFLAAYGYAVLQVNYRGSGGRGTDFLEAGKGAWGQAIEDDIEAAIDLVLERRLADADRVCLLGYSYGGYSALIGLVRNPGRYRCAVAIAAPTDLLLLFDSSDFAATPEGREHLADILGDPDEGREHLLAISPAYRAEEFIDPVLIIHGALDRRVDVEHAHRMKAMLEVRGKAVEWMILDDVGHDPVPERLMQIMRKSEQFLARHLFQPEDPVRQDAIHAP